MNGAVIREFRKEDFWNGFLKSLDSLKQASDIDKNKAELIFEKINVNPDHVIAAVEIDGNRCLHNTAYRIKIH